MILRRLLTITILLTSTIWSQAQQINAVPDYVFRNQMSVGRNAVTDTAAYFSIGPRYGATKGFMPPIVGDTATFSSGKRNGLLIFSVQKNKFLYWDSVRVQWSDMAGGSGSYILAGDTSAMLAPYLRKADTTAMLLPYVRHAGYGLTKSGQSFLVDTLNIATRAWRQKGIDSVVSIIPAAGVGGSGTTNYLPKFTAGTTIGNSQIFDNGTSVGIGTASPNASYLVEAVKNGDVIFNLRTTSATGNPYIRAQSTTTNVYSAGIAQSTGTSAPFVNDGAFQYTNGAGGMQIITGTATPIQYFTNNTERLRIFANGRVFIGASPTDAGYQLDVNGTLRSVNGANFATTSGNVGIGTASPSTFLSSNGTMTINGGVPGLLLQEAGTLSGFFASNGTQLVIDARTTRDIDFQTSATVRLRIRNDGELLVNTTTDAGDYKLQVSGNIYNTGSAVLAATSGIVGIGTTSPTALASTSGLLHVNGASTNSELHLTNTSTGAAATDGGLLLQFGTRTLLYNLENSSLEFGTNNTERGRINSAGEWIIDASGTDAGDYKLQVVGNARIGTGKLDIASNTTFGLGVARSGTSEVAGQIYNSNGILYLGAESSAGGQIFSGSSAYAAVIGSGANYPLQFATNNITRATMTTSGNLLLGFTTDSYFLKLQVNGSIFSNNQVLAQGVNAQIAADSSTNISPLYISNQSLTGSSAQGLFYGSTTWNTTGNPSLIDLAITNTASGSDANYIKISDGSNIFRVTKAAEVVTAAPTGGSIRKWKLGEAATVSPTSPNRTIRVEIDGTVYYLHAKTTND